MKELQEIIVEIQDNLVPLLDVYEQAIYHYLFRHTYMVGEEACIYSTKSAEIGFGTGDNSKRPSDTTRSKKLRSLEAKGCIEIIERSHRGIRVKLLLPHQIPSVELSRAEEDDLNLEELDFYQDRRLLGSLLHREGYRCFYTGRKISSENCYLDHVIPQANLGGNSYTNIVATCYDANSMKNDKTAEEFVRYLYKEEIISIAEFQELKEKLARLQAGAIQPDLELVRAAIRS